MMLLLVLLTLVGVGVTQDDPNKAAETERKLSICPEHKETLKDLMTSNKCSNDERIPLTDIADELAEKLADLLLESDWEVLKVKGARSRRAPRCGRVCTPTCMYRSTGRCYYSGCENVRSYPLTESPDGGYGDLMRIKWRSGSVTQDDPNKAAETERKLSLCPEHRETLKDLMTSNKCSNNERIPLTDIADDLAEDLADLLLESDWEVLKVKGARSRRAPECTETCVTRYRNVCTNSCEWTCGISSRVTPSQLPPDYY